MGTVAAVCLGAAVWSGAAPWSAAARVGPPIGGPVGTPAAGRTTATGARPLEAVPATGSSSPIPSLDERVPTGPPADVSWQVWHTVALPYSASAGPARTVGDVVAGFARTPTGALLAAVQASARRVAATDASWRQIADQLLAPGPGRDAWIAARGRTTLPAVPPPGTFAQVAGFAFVSYSPTDAVVQMVSRDADGALGVIVLHVAWSDGDWRLVLTPDGSDAAAQQRATSLAGFVAWGGV